MIKTFIKRDEIFSRELSIYFLRETPEQRSFVSLIEWTVMPRDSHGVEVKADPIRLQPDDAQYLMDALWDAGLRPSEGSGSAGALAATQKHLEDMRSIVFKKESK